MIMSNVQHQVFERIEFKICILIVFAICSILVSYNVVLGEIEVMNTFATTQWQKDFFKGVFTAIAIVTPIIIPATVILKKAGLSRWKSVGITLSILLTIYEFVAIDHIVLRAGMDNSNTTKEKSLTQATLSSNLTLLKTTGQSIQVNDKHTSLVSLQDNLTKEKTSLKSCGRFNQSCKRIHKSKIVELTSQISARQDENKHIDETSTLQLQLLNANNQLLEISKKQDEKVVAASGFRMLYPNDPDKALFVQLIFSHFVALLITIFNTLSLLVVGGVAASLGVLNHKKTDKIIVTGRT